MPKARKSRKKLALKVDVTAGLEALHYRAAGIDVGNAEHYVAVSVGRDPQPALTFGSFTADLHRMGQLLKACRIETVVMRATGVYWIALYEVPDSYGWSGQRGECQIHQDA